MRDVYSFGNGRADGGAHLRDLLGGKGANLAEMSNLGVPVPPGFTVTSAICDRYLKSGTIPTTVVDQIRGAMTRLERDARREFGNPKNPLLVSVRSGARISMPGMMDTILNLGLNDDTAAGLARLSGNPRFAFDSYRRFVQMYGEVVFGVKANGDGGNPFERVLDRTRQAAGVERDIDLSTDDLRSLVGEFKQIITQDAGVHFPDDPWEQLWGAVEAVFRSWQTKRAREYRRVNAIPESFGTAVNVVAMVYGNMGEDSGTGVAFSRNPSTGEPAIFGEFLANAQGEDVVAGRRDPEPIANMQHRMPEAFAEFTRTVATLERHFTEVQDIEFTVEQNRLFILQTRDAKRTAQAAVRIAVDFAREGLIDQRDAVRRVQPNQLDQLLHPTVDPSAVVEVLATGLPASPGAAAGRAVFDADTARAWHDEQGAEVILIRRETSPDDFHGMVTSRAILTQRGGMTSHAAVVARGMGTPCIVGCKEIDVDESTRTMRVNDLVLNEGDWITVDGSTGRVLAGRAQLVEPGLGPHFEQLMVWADQFRMLRVRANADTAQDAKRAREFGAEGIGLCRTEHMFFEGNRITAMREMILSRNEDERRAALRKLLPMQRGDFLEIFKAMDGCPVTVRLLDPPLHEFLPRTPEDLLSTAEALDVPIDRLRHTVSMLTEANPMLGHRGCRLGLTFPEITEMQARAIFEAACDADEQGCEVYPEIMVPLIAHVEELNRQAQVVRESADSVFAARGRKVGYMLGTMIELPRAALTADEIAHVAEFFSFGTNDLTQTTFGLSRDDAGRFLPMYVESGVLSADPFQTLDRHGVGRLVGIGVGLGRETNPKIKIGICGEHGGDPESITFCHHIGLNYVSCSPFRVPIARLAAAHAALADFAEHRSLDTDEVESSQSVQRRATA